jgi:hypothetical protein
MVMVYGGSGGPGINVLEVARSGGAWDRHHSPAVKPQIMYIARVDAGGRTKWARIGRVGFSKTGRTLYYAGRELRGVGQPWYRDTETGEQFHVRRAREDGLDRSEGRKRGGFPVEIDDDVREEYWREVRGNRIERTSAWYAASRVAKTCRCFARGA